ncbi:hypothetical protein AAVH_36044 [Aphelenchoides avenae]|nr:hypothetical protein AAVH_36044 [Aphelenchus avenae]
MSRESIREIRDKVDNSNWRVVPYRNAVKPTDTFGEIVSESFNNVKRYGRSASHCRFDEMYAPRLGDLRTSKTYSALSPSNGVRYR